MHLLCRQKSSPFSVELKFLSRLVFNEKILDQAHYHGKKEKVAKSSYGEAKIMSVKPVKDVSTIINSNGPGILRSLELALAECIPHSSEETKIQYSVLRPNEPATKLLSNQVPATMGTSQVSKLKAGRPKIVTQSCPDNHRWNEVNIQMLSKDLYEQLFANVKDSKSGPTTEQIENARKELLKHNLLSSKQTVADEVHLKLPPLEGANIEDHFSTIGESQSAPYRKLLQSLTNSLPSPPLVWSTSSGWTCYDPEPHAVDFPADDALVFDVEVCMSAGAMPTLATAASPTCWYSWVSPILAENANPGVKQHYTTADFIPLESTAAQRGVKHGLLKPRIAVGHNVSYDRARVKEQYWLEETGMRFIDTMSMHVCVSGITSYQRAVLKSKAEEAYGEEWRHVGSLNNLSEVHKLYCGETLDKTSRNVFVSGDMKEVSEQFQELMNYCAGDVLATHRVLQKLLPMFLERFPHPVTLAGMLELGTAYLPVNENWTRYISDANQTFEDLDSEGRFLLARQADKACQLLHENKYQQDLWMWDQDWTIQEFKLKKTITKSKSKNTTNLLDEEIEENLDAEKTKESKKHVFKRKHIESELLGRPKQDVLQDDAEAKALNKEMIELEEKFSFLEDTRAFLPVRVPHLPGYPAWYRKLCLRPNTPDWSPGPQLVSTSMQVTPKLLRLTWESFPLHYIRGHGWGLLVPYKSESNLQMPIKQLIEKCHIAGPNESEEAMGTLHKDVQETLAKREYGRKKPVDTGIPAWYKGTGLWCNVDVGGCCWFLKLPHKDGSTHRVGNPLAKDFLNKFSENVLAGSDLSAEKVLSIGRQLSYWRNNKERIENQLVVWLDDKDLPRSVKGSLFGGIIPQVVVSGTLTRRAVEATWMTASNAHGDRVGSELRSMIQAPKGYSFVGADVDSQELWIASVIGDAHYAQTHGATPLGWMTLNGRKADGTDMHSVTAKAVGISRDHSKVINYARIYGAGQSFAERLLKQFNPLMSPSEAKSKAAKMFSLTKGKRTYRLKGAYRENLPDKNYSMYEALKLRRQHGVSIDEMFERPKWVGGTESAMFNRLEEIASLPSPSTPFLNGRLSRSLEPSLNADERFLPTRVNWVVQSGAVDFLHLMLVAMKWLEPKIRFCLSFHDEVRYIVPNELRYHAALSLHVTNLMARAFCASRLGIKDLPQSVAFFGSVEVDQVLRKEAHHDCVTPSNPHGLERGYGVPLGESLDIYQAIAKAGNSLQIRDMSRATKRKHVVKEVTLDELTLPAENQSVVRIIASRGNNLHEVEDSLGERYLVSMPTKFRKNMWVKRGDFLLVEPIEEGDKVKGEMVMILTQEHIRYYKQEKVWPEYFLSKKAITQDGELFVNTNRPVQEFPISSSSSGDSDSEVESK